MGDDKLSGSDGSDYQNCNHSNFGGVMGVITKNVITRVFFQHTRESHGFFSTEDGASTTA